MRAPWVMALALLLGLAASAQREFTSSDHVYIPEGIMRGSPRVFGIAGAFTGIAEGADGLMHNPAALSNRSPPFDHDFRFDVSGIFHMLPTSALSSQDWDNDGRADQTVSNSGVFGTILAGFAVAASYKRVGLGLGFDAQGYNYRYFPATGPTDLGVATGHVFGALSVSLFDDDLLLGAGVETSTLAVFSVESPRRDLPSCPLRPEADDCYSYSGLGAFAGVLWRPNRANWRLGASFKPPTVARPDRRVFGGQGPDEHGPLSGLILPAGAYSPARLSVGFSKRFFSEEHIPYNLYAGDYELDEHGILKGSEVPPLAPSRDLMVTAEVTVIIPTLGADTVALNSFFQQHEAGNDAVLVGDRVMFIPRVALEGEPVADWVRVRLGSYLEPSAFPGGPLRPHATLGLEVALFTLWQRWCLGASVDFGVNPLGFGKSSTEPPRWWPASYFNLSAAILVWK